MNTNDINQHLVDIDWDARIAEWDKVTSDFARNYERLAASRTEYARATDDRMTEGMEAIIQLHKIAQWVGFALTVVGFAVAITLISTVLGLL